MSWGDPVRNGLSVGIGTLASLTSSSGIGGIRRPTMSLNFLLMSATSLDSRITFSRGTNATLTDSTGRVTFAPNNVVTNSVGPSANTGTTVATVSGAAPDGTNAVRLSKTDATTPRYSNWTTLFTVQANTAYVASAYFKYDGFNTTVSVEYNNGTHFGTTWVATFNVTASGITANSPSNCTSGVQAVGNGWFRVWAAFTSGTPSAPTNPTFLTQITGGAGTTVLVTWGQLEQVTYQTTPSTYVATAGSSYYGPRFDYDPVTLAARGLLIEEQRSNLLTYSAQFDDAVWSKLRATVTANSTAAPDGTTTADTLLDTAVAGTHVAIQTITKAASAITYAASVWLKADVRNQGELRVSDQAGNGVRCTFNLTTAAVGAATAFGAGFTAVSSQISQFANGWYRVVLVATSNTATTLGHEVYIADAGGNTSYTGTGAGFFVWGAQLEAGAFATSYIPTVASTVTRNADVATMTGTNFSSWYNQAGGTFALNADSIATTDINFPLTASDGTGSNRFGIYRAGLSIAGYIVTGGATVMEIITNNAFAVNTPFRVAAAATANDGNVSFNGNIGTTDTSITMPTVNQLGIGNNAGGGFYSGHIRSIAYYNTRLSNSQLQTLTAPSLSSTLSLDFINGAYNVGF